MAPPNLTKNKTLNRPRATGYNMPNEYELLVRFNDGRTITMYAADIDTARKIARDLKTRDAFAVDVWGPAQKWGRPFIGGGRFR